MGYAFFAQRKLCLDSSLHYLEMMQTQRSNDQFRLATGQTELNQRKSAIETAKASELADKYEELSEATDSDERTGINAEIAEIQENYKIETAAIEREINEIAQKEAVIEMEVKRLDSQKAKVQKEFEAICQAEEDAMDRATPKFSGLS